MQFEKNKKTKTHNTFGIFLLKTVCVFVVVFFSFTFFAHAATLGFSPSSSNVHVGDSVRVKVLVNSSGQSINAVSGAVSFSSDLLSLTSISKSGSIIVLWAQEPTYSNISGTASFQGVALNGYTGNAGTVLTLTFRAKKTGSATFALSGSSSVLLNDGNGTNALSGTSGATITVAAASTTPQAPEIPTPEPVISEPIPEPVVVAPVQLMTPVITDYASSMLENTFIVVKGTADQNTAVDITLSSIDMVRTGVKPIVSSVMTDAKGNFTYVTDTKVPSGTYSVVAYAHADDGRTSVSTQPITIVAHGNGIFNFGVWIATIFSIKVPFLICILILLAVIFYMSYRFKQLRRTIKQTIEVEHHLSEPH